MLHRAASNAYSWWWASHIRTKQSKWLDNNLQDVEVRVENVIKMIEEDGDSFAQKAEMYYRKRPELIKFVEEFYRAYRALAERYDHISGELHKANKTLATVFPDQLHHLSDADDASADKTLAAVFPDEDQKEEETRSPPPAEPPESPEATVNSKEEIEKLLKGILVLQTEKEFIKSCYESSLAKYWEIEGKMTEMQKEVCLLQDRHGVSMAIEDDEARALMAATALKTCEAALVNLQEHQRQAMEEAGLASARIRVSKGKLQTLKSQGEGSVDSVEISGSAEAEVASCLAMAEGRLELQTMCEKMKEHFEKASVEEMAEKIDELAEKIIGLEVKASSQTAQIRHLRNEVEELEKNLERMEEEKAAVGSDGKIGDVEKELLQLQFLESSVKDEGEKLLSDFSVACRSFADISERFQGEGEERLKEEEDVDEALRSSFDHECENFQSGDCGSIHGDQDEDGEERENGIDPSEKIQLKEEEEKRENGIDPSEKMQLKEEEEKENGINPSEKMQLKEEEERENENNPSEKMQLKEEEEEREKGIDPSEKIQLKEEEEERENGIDPSEKMQLKEEEDERENGVDPSEKMQLKEEEEEKGEERENGIDPSENIQLKEEEEERENGIDPSEKLQLKEEEEKRENGIDPSEKIQLKDEEEERGNGIDPSKKMQLKEEEEEEEAGGGPLNWQQMLLVSGLEGREKLLLNEYTSILRNYKETKRRIFEMEKRHQQHISETTVKIRGLMQAAAAKDEEILSLRSKLRSLEFSRCPENEERESSSPPAIPPPDKEEESLEDGAFPAKEIDLQVPEEPESSNAIEESFRREIDGLLEENLEFWLRFSASFQQMQRLQASWKSLQAEILQVGGNGGGGGSGTASSSDASPDFLFKDLGNLQSELLSWLEENTQLKSELQLRFSSLGRIKEEMSRVLAESAGEEESQLTAYRAAKFHGELLSMQQENNKVAEDLRAGLGTAKSVQAEVERAMARLRRSLGVVSPAKTQPHYHFRHFSGKSRIPLKSILLFGAKPKPKKPSLFSCMNPALQKQYSDLSPGLQPRN